MLLETPNMMSLDAIWNTFVFGLVFGLGLGISFWGLSRFKKCP